MNPSRGLSSLSFCPTNLTHLFTKCAGSNGSPYSLSTVNPFQTTTYGRTQTTRTKRKDGDSTEGNHKGGRLSWHRRGQSRCNIFFVGAHLTNSAVQCETSCIRWQVRRVFLFATSTVSSFLERGVVVVVISSPGWKLPCCNASTAVWPNEQDWDKKKCSYPSPCRPCSNVTPTSMRSTSRPRTQWRYLPFYGCSVEYIFSRMAGSKATVEPSATLCCHGIHSYRCGVVSNRKCPLIVPGRRYHPSGRGLSRPFSLKTPRDLIVFFRGFKKVRVNA